MLEKIGGTLEQNDIRVVFCKGNVIRRNKAIREFHDQNDVRVIMLSLDSAASGTNLTQGDEFCEPAACDLLCQPRISF